MGVEDHGWRGSKWRAILCANVDAPPKPACLHGLLPILNHRLFRRAVPPSPLQALQFRLREDLKAAGGDLAAFDQLKEASGGAVWEGVACVASRVASRKQGAPVTQTG